MIELLYINYGVFVVEFSTMMTWLKSKSTVIIVVLVTIGFLLYCYGCEPKVTSLWHENKQINRQELQLEFDQLMGIATVRMVELDKQDKIRAIILDNAMILVEGEPFNPLGLITAIAAVYGIKQGGSNITKVVKEARKKKQENNG